MKAYALTSLPPTPISHSYYSDSYSYSSPNPPHILHSLTMEPHLIDWQLETHHHLQTITTTTNPNHNPTNNNRFQHHHQNHHYHDHHLHLHNHQDSKHQDEDEDEDDIDFTFTCIASASSPVSADEIFFNGRIKPLNPSSNPILNHDQVSHNKQTISTRLPLLKLMSQEEDRDFSFASTGTSSSASSSCSSSDDDELEGISPESYCVWRPPNATKNINGSRRRRGKSNSTGTMSSSSSKRWTLKDMLMNKNLNENGKASKPSCIRRLSR